MVGRDIPTVTLILGIYLIVCGVLYLIFAEKVYRAISESREHYARLRGTHKTGNTTGKGGPFNGKTILRILAVLAILWGIYVIISARPPG